MQFLVWRTCFPLVVFAALCVNAKALPEVPSVLWREESYEVDKEFNATFSLFGRAGTDVIDPRFLNGCVKVCGGQQCCGSRKKSSKVKPRGLLSKRAFVEDVSSYSQQQLGDYIIQRAVTDANTDMSSFEFVLDTDNELPLSESIYMKLLAPGPNDGDLPIPMPTSRFMPLGDQPYNLVMRSLSGCTLVTAIKPFDPAGPADQPIGVWMGHMWEMPSFIPETEENDENDIEGSDPGGSATGEPVIQIARTFDTWVLQFMATGFPGPNLPQLGTKPASAPDPTPQEGITPHLDVLKGAYYYIMHPNKEVPPADGGTMGYDNTPQYPNDLIAIKSQITTIDPTAHVSPEFLYKAQKGYDFDEWETSPTGKALFEYVPNRNGRRFGRLIMEDGGVHNTICGNTQPGLKEFDFGPSTS